MYEVCPPPTGKPLHKQSSDPVDLINRGTSPRKHGPRDIKAGSSVNASSTGANPGIPLSSTMAGAGLGPSLSSTTAGGAHTRAAMTEHTPFVRGGTHSLGQKEVMPLSYVTPGPYFPKDTSGQ